MTGPVADGPVATAGPQRISFAFPQDPRRSANAYLLDDAAGSHHLIDCGPDSDANWALLESVLAGRGATAHDLASVTVTHAHFDHIGMAARIRHRTGAEIRMHRRDWEVIDGDQEYGGPDPEALLVAWGVPEARHPELLEACRRPVAAGERVEPDRLLQDGEELHVPGRDLAVIATPGHTHGHLCVVDRGRSELYTGDHLLPDQHPGVGLGGWNRGNPMVEYLGSLERIAASGARRGLPGHGAANDDLPARIARTSAHQLRRGEQIEGLEAGDDVTTWEVATRLGWSRDWASFTGMRLFSALNQVDQHRRRNAAQRHPERTS